MIYFPVFISFVVVMSSMGEFENKVNVEWKWTKIIVYMYESIGIEYEKRD